MQSVEKQLLDIVKRLDDLEEKVKDLESKVANGFIEEAQKTIQKDKEREELLEDISHNTNLGDDKMTKLLESFLNRWKKS